jgi:hypothetical protein
MNESTSDMEDSMRRFLAMAAAAAAVLALSSLAMA